MRITNWNLIRIRFNYRSVLNVAFREYFYNHIAISSISKI